MCVFLRSCSSGGLYWQDSDRQRDKERCVCVCVCVGRVGHAGPQPGTQMKAGCMRTAASVHGVPPQPGGLSSMAPLCIQVHLGCSVTQDSLHLTCRWLRPILDRLQPLQHRRRHDESDGWVLIDFTSGGQMCEYECRKRGHIPQVWPQDGHTGRSAPAATQARETCLLICDLLSSFKEKTKSRCWSADNIDSCAYRWIQQAR